MVLIPSFYYPLEQGLPSSAVGISNYRYKEKKCRTLHKSGSRSDDQRYQQRNGRRNSPADSKETFVANSSVTGCVKHSCSREVENKSTEIDDGQNNTPSWVQFWNVSHLLISRSWRLPTHSRFEIVKILHWPRVDSWGRVEDACIHKDRTSHGDNTDREQRVKRYRTVYITSRSTRYR